MPTTIHTTLYDTAPFGTTALTEFVLFQTPQGADGTHTESFTNARGAGSLANDESFVIREIVVFPDYNVPKADVSAITRGSFIEIRVSDKSLFKAPLSQVIGSAAYGGSDTTTAAANAQLVGLLGDGFQLDPAFYINIPGGSPFRVRIVQGTALAAGSSNIKCSLVGILTFGS